MLFRLSDLQAVAAHDIRARRTVSYPAAPSASLQPAQTAPPPEQVDVLEQFMTPLAPTPVLFHPTGGMPTEKKSYVVPLAVGLGVPLILGIVFVALVLHFYNPGAAAPQAAVASITTSAGAVGQRAKDVISKPVIKRKASPIKVASAPKIADQANNRALTAEKAGAAAKQTQRAPDTIFGPSKTTKVAKRRGKRGKRLSKRQRRARRRALARARALTRRARARKRRAAWAARRSRSRARALKRRGLKARRARAKRGGDNIDALLAGAANRRSTRKHRSQRVAMLGSAKPQRLTASQIKAGIRSIKPQVLRCHARFKASGMARVQVSIARSGRVSSTRVKGQFAQTPTGKCIAAAARKARFPAFSGKPITFVYPFVLR